ncbi:hypothetical protein L6R50_17990 [Myxococcota bacterium]|nr:hypothetical protein [Myxococcota bacterium]
MNSAEPLDGPKDPRAGRAPRGLLLAVPLLAVTLMAACSFPKARVAPVDSIRAPSSMVFDRLDDLDARTFDGVPLGRVRLSELSGALGLDRYSRQDGVWGPPDRSFRVVVLADPRTQGTTALVLESEDPDPVVASVLVRGFSGAPPVQRRFEDFLPWLSERFRPPYDVYDVPPTDETAHLKSPRRDRYAFPRSGGVKLGFLQAHDGQWSLDNVEFFSPDWTSQALARLKNLPQLRKVGVLRPGVPFKDPLGPSSSAAGASTAVARH